MYFFIEFLYLLWQEICQEVVEVGSFISIIIMVEIWKILCGGEERENYVFF